MPVIELEVQSSTDAVKAVDNLSRLIKNHELLNESDFETVYANLDALMEWADNRLFEVGL